MKHLDWIDIAIIVAYVLVMAWVCVTAFNPVPYLVNIIIGLTLLGMSMAAYTVYYLKNNWPW